MNFKKILALLLVIAVCCGITAGLTVAYLTDEDEEHNVFTVGNIDIDLREKVGVIGAGTVVKNEGEGAEHGATYTNVMPGDKLQKEVTIANTGANPAYVAVTVILNNVSQIHSAIDKFYEAKYGENAPEVQEAYSQVFQGWGINYNPRPGAYGMNDARRVIDGTFGLPEHVLHVDYTQTTYKNDTYQISVGNWFKSEKEAENPTKYSGYTNFSTGFHTGDLGGFSREMGEYELKYTYYLYLEPGEESVLFEGLNVPYEFNEDQIKMFENLKIDIYAAGIQASGFADAKTAFAALAGQTVNHVDVANVEELKEALANNSGYTVINANGADLGDVDDITFNDGVTLMNATFSGASNYGNNANGTVTFMNCKFISTDSYAAHFDGGDGNLVFINCEFAGWNSFGTAIKGITFTDCKFGFNGNYGTLRVYQDATFTNCSFDADFEWVDTNANGTTVSFTDCTGITTAKIFNNGDNVGSWFINGEDVSSQITTH